MAKDYAKRSVQRNRRPNRPGYRIWILVSCSSALIIIGWLLLEAKSKLSVLPLAKFIKTAPSTNKNTVGLPFKVPQPTLDFYNVLPQDQLYSTPKSTQPTVTERRSTAPAPINEPSPNNTPASPLISEVNPQKIATTAIQEQLEADLVQDSVSITLALAAFKDPTKASQFQTKLISEGLDAQIKTLERSGKILYRVYLGPYHSLEEAQQKQQQLHKKHIQSILIDQTPIS